LTTSPSEDRAAEQAGIWRCPGFPRLWGGGAASQLADQFYVFALPWLVYDVTQSGVQMSLVFGVQTIPYIVFGLLGGALADAWSAKRVLVIGNATACAVLVVFYVGTAGGPVPTWTIYATAVTLASGVAVRLAAFDNVIVALVPRALLLRGNSLVETTSTLSLMAGPAVAGLVIGLLGTPMALLLDAALFGAAAVVFATIRAQPPSSHRTARVDVAGVLRSSREGLTYAVRHPTLRWGMTLSTSANILFGAYEGLLILYLREDLHFSAAKAGVIFTIGSIAALAAATFLHRLSGHRTRSASMLVSLGAQGAAAALVIASPFFVVIAAAQAAMASAETIYAITWRTLRQETTSAPMIGRVSGASRGVAFAGASFGGFLGAGALTLGAGPRLLLLSAGLGVIVIAILCVRGPAAPQQEPGPPADMRSPSSETSLPATTD
jgi:predicted MFS family arabinose efflux permease